MFMFEILLSSFIVMLASLIGVIFIWKRLYNFVENNLKYLVSFSAGVFLMVSFNLGDEVLTHSPTFYYGAFWIILGALGANLIFKMWPTFHHHHDTHEKHKHSKLDEKKILFADGLHNIGDGILIASSFIINPVLGTLATISVFIHEIVQEVSEFFVLKQAGYSTRKALTVNFVVSSSILIGALGTIFIFEYFENLEIPVLGISTGVFLLVVIHDLIPHSIRSIKESPLYLKHIGFFVVGIIMMLIVGILTADSHSHAVHDDSHDEHHEDGLNEY